MTITATAQDRAAELGVDAIVDTLPDWFPVVSATPEDVELGHRRADAVAFWMSMELDHIANPTRDEVAAVRRFAQARARLEHPSPRATWMDREEDSVEESKAYRAAQAAKRAARRPVVMVHRKTYGRAHYVR